MASTTVLVATYNRAAWLRETLLAIERCLVPDVEVVVIDNASTDDTPRILADLARRMPLRPLGETKANKRFAVRTGVIAARGDLVIVCDDDAIPESAAWVRAYEEAAAAHPEAAFFGGPVRPWLPGGARIPPWYAELARDAGFLAQFGTEVVRLRARPGRFSPRA